MASRFTWTNEDGLVVTGGTRDEDNTSAGRPSKGGAEQEVSLVLPEGEIAQSTLGAVAGATIPVGAVITDVVLQSTGALTSLVDLIVGVADADGGSDLTDADGLVLAADAAEVVALRPSGSVVGTDFDGALLTTSVPLTEDVNVTVAATTASAAGDVKVVVKYVK